jgi:peptidoglycan glycosyltransferase
MDIYDDLLGDENAVLLNRTTNGLYPPGSTFKILTALAYVNQYGENLNYVCQGEDSFGDKDIHCYKNTAHGSVDVKSAFALSCNTAFATMGVDLDLKDFQSLAEDMLFNAALPYDFNYVKSSFSLPDTVTDALRAETVIGQGETLITPLHNLLITSAVANGGQLMKPYLVDRVVNKNGDLVNKTLPESSVKMLNTTDSALIKSYMEAVVSEGTGKGLQSDAYDAAGKTGSAENPFGDTHAWFVGFAPVENPRIAVAIIVENSGSSSSNSIPIAKKLFDYYLSLPESTTK